VADIAEKTTFSETHIHTYTNLLSSFGVNVFTLSPVPARLMRLQVVSFCEGTTSTGCINTDFYIYLTVLTLLPHIDKQKKKATGTEPACVSVSTPACWGERLLAHRF